MNPFLNRQAQNNKLGVAGRHSEKRVIQSLGGRLTPASGAMRGAKGDGVLPQFLVECKSTTRQSIALEIGWLSKISAEALSQSKQPMLTLSFVREDGKPQMSLNSDWVCIPRHVFQELTEKE